QDLAAVDHRKARRGLQMLEVASPRRLLTVTRTAAELGEVDPVCGEDPGLPSSPLRSGARVPPAHVPLRQDRVLEQFEIEAVDGLEGEVARRVAAQQQAAGLGARHVLDGRVQYP